MRCLLSPALSEHNFFLATENLAFLLMFHFYCEARHRVQGFVWRHNLMSYYDVISFWNAWWFLWCRERRHLCTYSYDIIWCLFLWRHQFLSGFLATDFIRSGICAQILMMSSLLSVYYDVISFPDGFMMSSFCDVVRFCAVLWCHFIHFWGNSSDVVFDVIIFCNHFTHTAMTSSVLHRRLRL